MTSATVATSADLLNLSEMGKSWKSVDLPFAAMVSEVIVWYSELTRRVGTDQRHYHLWTKQHVIPIPNKLKQRTRARIR